LQIKSVVFVADFDSDTAFIAPDSMTVFFEVPKNGDWTPMLLQFKKTVLLAMNKFTGAIQSDDGVCYNTKTWPPYEGYRSIHIWDVVNTPIRFRRVANCSRAILYPYDELIGTEMIYTSKSILYTASIFQGLSEIHENSDCKKCKLHSQNTSNVWFQKI